MCGLILYIAVFDFNICLAVRTQISRRAERGLHNDEYACDCESWVLNVFLHFPLSHTDNLLVTRV
jgi:hypothetical protein